MPRSARNQRLRFIGILVIVLEGAYICNHGLDRLKFNFLKKCTSMELHICDPLSLDTVRSEASDSF